MTKRKRTDDKEINDLSSIVNLGADNKIMKIESLFHKGGSMESKILENPASRNRVYDLAELQQEANFITLRDKVFGDKKFHPLIMKVRLYSA